ncbi:MAG: PAS domain S-box protein, partial [Chloroflexi bacterium]|nr:PAS domain S-box protein [Chloroflexota bacterium]
MISEYSLSDHLYIFAQAYENLGDAVTVVDTEDCFVFVNAAFEEMYGYAKDEIIGQPLSLIVPPGQVPITEDSFDVGAAP